MLVRRIIYILEPFPVPFGGVATIYQHVELLSKNSLPAYVALRERPSWSAAICNQSAEGFSVYVNALMRTPAKRLMFCQNQYNLPFAPTPRPGVGEFGVHGIIASSKAVQKFFADVYGLADLPLLPCAIDTQRFAAAKHKKRQIAFMPRKLLRKRISSPRHSRGDTRSTLGFHGCKSIRSRKRKPRRLWAKARCSYRYRTRNRLACRRWKPWLAGASSLVTMATAAVST